ncbi:head-tail connector protein [Parerythrobacter lacustris]|uniref:Phage head-tail connector protein n=1 Tax=Parerythrobacter lacustris TaxID=2969984 RepID=A0ABT1XUZ2_9SPHN|nr:phage head-tail connector protein [Parerythrobacter lacustris]MCR2834257.1 phage head-tail connector protein [Parerythrobacter lacustris]
MRRAILAPAELGGAALGELKSWLAITNAQEDALLTGLLGAAVEACEGFTCTMPLQQTCEEVHTASPGWQRLRSAPVQAITGVEAIPAEGPRFMLAADAYEIELEADGSGMVRVLRQGAAGRIAVRFVAGLTPGWGSLPEALRHGIVRLAAHLYRERDAADPVQPPAAVTALWRPWRRVRLT